MKIEALDRLVLVVEDDASFRNALERMLLASGYLVRSAKSAEELMTDLSSPLLEDKLNQRSVACCILMDVGLGGMTGLEAQRIIKSKHPEIPIIFMSGAADANSVNQAWRDGAQDFIFKPFRISELKELLDNALFKFITSHTQFDSTKKERVAEPVAEKIVKLEKLTAREVQVLQRVAEGNKNQEIADALGISLRTVKMHRSNLMRKLKITHVADLVRFYERFKGVV